MPELAHTPGIKVYTSDQIVQYSRTKDSFRRYLTDGVTPSGMAAILKSVDQGDIAALWEVNEEMEAKDARIQAVVETRRRALTALDWAIEPDPEAGSAGQVLADYVGKVLVDMPTWPTTLEHLATAVGPNIALTELIWKKARLFATVDVPGHRLRANTFLGQGIFIETEDEPLGVEATPGKFIIYHPHERAGFPLRVTMTHSVVVPFLMKHFSRADWMAFSEIYGMPWRWVEFTDAVVDADRATAKEMIENIGSDTAAALPEGAQVKTLEITGAGDTFERQLKWADGTISILYLGQTGTTEIGDHGSFAAIRVHDNVRGDLLVSDIKKERRMIREQVIRPMCRLRFPANQAPCPHFVRKTFESRDVDSERLDLEQARAMREWGLPLLVDEMYKRTGFTKPEGFEQETLGGAL